MVEDEKREVTCCCGVAYYIGNRWRGVTIKDGKRLICIKCRAVLLKDGKVEMPND